MTGERRLTGSLDGPVAVEAAGGVVLRHTAEGVEVLVVHRVRYDDWSLPKGKLDPGEDHATAAVREIAEETAVDARIRAELSQVVYEVPAGIKRVRWYVMDPVGGDPADRAADREVDVARWVDAAEAPALLTYAADADLLAEALSHPGSGGGS